ncbi:MAG TPA: UbiH/UbiF family hydroxylase [Burkholderiales bacterium]|nr:UbiH/UbiF family hydroxylase [Burkholderiales bacterium]
MHFDIVIVGAGLVGASLALALRGTGLRVALVEPRPLAPLPGDGSWDTRVYAISPGSAAFLAAGGAWERLDPARLGPVLEMEIRGDDSASELRFSAYDAGVPELATILESRLLAAAIWEVLQGQPDLELFCPAACAALALEDSGAVLTLDDGRALGTALVVGADGAESWVRSQAGIAAVSEPYGQMGVVANFAIGTPHRGIARQWFRRDGVLALLPLAGDQVSMVWSTWDEPARELAALEPQALCVRLADATRGVTGELSVITPATAFPLRLLRLKTCIGRRVALIGDAAHNVHPLAGQGVNLGFRDARELAAVLAGRGAQPDCGHHGLLRRYERARREDVLLMQFTTDRLQKLFNNDNPALAQARNLGLRLTEQLAPAKNFLIRHALG